MEEDVNQEEGNLDNMSINNMNNIVADKSSPLPIQNCSTTTSSHIRKRNRPGDDNDATTIATFKEMFKKSV